MSNCVISIQLNHLTSPFLCKWRGGVLLIFHNPSHEHSFIHHHLRLKDSQLCSSSEIPKWQEETFHQPPSSSHITLIWAHIYLRPLGEVIYGHRDTLVTGTDDWKCPQYVHSHSFQWGTWMEGPEWSLWIFWWLILCCTGSTAVDSQLHISQLKSCHSCHMGLL